jgi:ketosteroid isomerase-like protein
VIDSAPLWRLEPNGISVPKPRGAPSWPIGSEDVMKAALFGAALAAAHLMTFAVPAKADWSDEVRATYLAFAAAQNARDLQKVRALLLDSPRFLWVSDGRSVWGPDATIARMESFQKAEVWRVEPSLAEAVPVRVGEDTAYLHLPLRLGIGSGAKPDDLGFLVSVLCARTPAGWRIAALFTTTDKRD